MPIAKLWSPWFASIWSSVYEASLTLAAVSELPGYLGWQHARQSPIILRDNIVVSNKHNWPEFYLGNARACLGLEPPMRRTRMLPLRNYFKFWTLENLVLCIWYSASFQSIIRLRLPVLSYQNCLQDHFVLRSDRCKQDCTLTLYTNTILHCLLLSWDTETISWLLPPQWLGWCQEAGLLLSDI